MVEVVLVEVLLKLLLVAASTMVALILSLSLQPLEVEMGTRITVGRQSKLLQKLLQKLWQSQGSCHA